MTDDIGTTLERFDHLDREESRLRSSLGAIDEGEASDVVEAYRRAVSLLDDYRDRATGSGDFGGYVEFRSTFSDFVEGLDADLAHRDAFETALDRVERRRLSGRDFDLAREALEPAEELAETLDALADLREERRDLRHDLVDAKRELVERRSQLVGLSDIQPDTVDTPVDDLREPIDRYNDAVSAEFRAFLRETPANDVLETCRRLSYFALLDIESPPPALESYLGDHAVGAEPIPDVLEYLAYSRSKLSHYVEDAGRFKTEVGHHRDYLDGLTPAPYRLSWPPPPRDHFAWKLRELQQAIHRFASASTIERLRELQSLCRDADRYERLRSAARLREDLNEEERQLVVSGSVDAELETVTGRIEAIDTALEASR